MLDLDPERQGPTPRDASTLVVVREGGGNGAPEVFCVERHKAGYLGGAVVFPGGKVDASDRDPAWADLVVGPSPTRTQRASLVDDAGAGAGAGADAGAGAGADLLRALAIAACREALEEAAILPLVGTPLTHAELLAWRAQLLRPRDGGLRALLQAHGRKLDLDALHPLARWVTPAAESRRFDTRFFVFAAPGPVTGAHDDRETTASFWATPAEVLARFDRRELVLAPPTHRTLEVLAPARSVAEVIAIAAQASLEPICPRAVRQSDATGETMAIALPGDPEHPVRSPRVGGASRFVLRDGRFVPEDPPGRG